MAAIKSAVIRWQLSLFPPRSPRPNFGPEVLHLQFVWTPGATCACAECGVVSPQHDECRQTVESWQEDSTLANSRTRRRLKASSTTLQNANRIEYSLAMAISAPHWRGRVTRQKPAPIQPLRRDPSKLHTSLLTSFFSDQMNAPALPGCMNASCCAAKNARISPACVPSAKW